MGFLSRVIFIFIFIGLAYTTHSQDTSIINGTDSVKKTQVFRRTSFIDSFLTDSLKNGLLSKFIVHIPSEKVPKVVDPLSPFNQKNYFISLRHKAWFMWTSLLIVILFILNRDATPFGISLRFKSLYNSKAFDELLSNAKSNIGFGSLLSNLTTMIVWSQFILEIFLIKGNYGSVNSFWFFSIIFSLLSGLRILFFFVGNLFCYSLNQLPFYRTLTFRQLNSDFLFSIPLFVLSVFLYFSPFGTNWSPSIDVWLLYFFIFYYFLRFVLSLTNNIQRGIPIFFIIAYFCAFEILPILLIIRIILNLLK